MSFFIYAYFELLIKQKRSPRTFCPPCRWERSVLKTGLFILRRITTTVIRQLGGNYFPCNSVLRLSKIIKRPCINFLKVCLAKHLCWSKDIITSSLTHTSLTPASSKPDYGLEELGTLNVKEKFSMFEAAGQEEEEKKLEPVPVRRSGSMISRAAKYVFCWCFLPLTCVSKCDINASSICQLWLRRIGVLLFHLFVSLWSSRMTALLFSCHWRCH